MAEIRVENLQKAFGDFVAVRGSDFTVEDGEFFCLLGPSGCGKTTTLADDRRAGAADRRPHPARRRGRHLQARLRARHRLRLPALRALSAHERAREHRLSACAARACRAPRSGAASRRRRGSCGSHHLLDRPVSGLSGGDRQRVALGRAIVRQPMAFLMDEPLGALDAEFRQLMCGELRALHDRLGATTVYVTHDQLEAMSMADKIAVMNHGADRAARHAARDLRPAGLDVRRRFHRLAADELPRVRRRRSRGAIDASASTARRSRCPSCARTASRARAACSACGPSTSASTDAAPLRGAVFGAEYLGTTQIVTVDDRARHA